MPSSRLSSLLEDQKEALDTLDARFEVFVSDSSVSGRAPPPKLCTTRGLPHPRVASRLEQSALHRTGEQRTPLSPFSHRGCKYAEEKYQTCIYSTCPAAGAAPHPAAAPSPKHAPPPPPPPPP
eukprot:Sspe_Gene.41459::Locus_20037_Transcript_3_3_Confidence_0.429_Length_424::g.41459::m.41459